MNGWRQGKQTAMSRSRKEAEKMNAITAPRPARMGLCAVAIALVIASLGVAPAQAASPAWQPVGATGPTVIPAERSEVQKLFVDAEGGTFTLTARERVAEGLGDVSTEFASSSPVTDVIRTNGAFAAGQRLEGFFLRPGTDIVSVSGSEMRTSKAASIDQYQDVLAAYASPATSAPLPYDATAAEVQTALESLAPIGTGNVEVSGGPGGPGASAPYTVAFKGALADTDVGLLEAGNGALEGNAVAKTTVPGGRGTSILTLMVQNIGGATSEGTITVRAKLPNGLTLLAKPTTGITQANPTPTWTCGASKVTEVVCTRDEEVRPGLTAPPVNAVITAAPGTTAGTVQIEASGGGASTATEDLPLTVSTTPARPGFQAFTASAYDDNGSFDPRAGGHPFTASSAIFVNTVRSVKGYVVPAGEPKDIKVKLPPGFLGNPNAVEGCPESTPTQDCNLDSAVGTVEAINEHFGEWSAPALVFDTKDPIGYPAKFRFRILESEEVNAVGDLRSDEDYGVDVVSPRTPQVNQVMGVFFTFWGEPASSVFDSLRCKAPNPGIEGIGAIRNEIGCRPSGTPDTALLTNATNCAEQAASPPFVRSTTTIWQLPGQLFETTFGIPPVTGCDQLHFEGSLVLRSSGSASDSPESFTTSLATPTEGLLDPAKRIDPPMQKVVVQMPQGVSLNPSGADGLASCSEAQIGYIGGNFPLPNPMHFDKTLNSCPDASKIGSGTLHTPLLAEPLQGTLYLAAQGSGNPFGTTFAVYLAIEDTRHGIAIKLPGKVETDQGTGQITVTFEHLPPYPVEKLDLTLKGGDRSALASPQTCGTFTTKTTFTPWSYPESGPPTVSESNLNIDSGANGAPCKGSESQLPFAVGFQAGTTDPVAGAHSPFEMRITRPDGAQNIDRFEMTAPQGFTATLRGVPYCSEPSIAHAASNGGRAEQASPSCPAASQIGATEVGAGAGPHPYYVDGKVYLAGPYEGAPLSLVAIVPAVAGPFDLGTQVVRAALRLNPATAQVTAVADPLPKLIEGVPLRIRDVRVAIDKPGFTLNPTDCSPKQVSAILHGTGGATADPANRFQVGGCARLGFKPKIFTRLYGGVHRGDFPRFRAVYRPKSGDANVKDLVLRFPRSEFIEQGHFRTICTRVQYNAGGGLGEKCPKGSIYGYVKAWTPLLDEPLKGPVYLRSSNHNLPDVVFALHGQVDAEASVRIDSVKGGLRATVEDAPDVPLKAVVVNMRGRQKGLFVNSRNICARNYRTAVRATAHNRRVFRFHTPLRNARCRKLRRRTQQRREHTHHHRARRHA